MLFLQAGESKMISDAENLRLEIATFYDRFLRKTDEILYLSPYLDAYNTGTVESTCLAWYEARCTVCTVIVLHLRNTIARHTRTVRISGMQVPLCVQVQKNHNLDGLMCIDLTFADYFDSVPRYSNQDTSYAFVFNSDLKTLVHPLLPQPTSITNDLTYVDITSLEVNLPTILDKILR